MSISIPWHVVKYFDKFSLKKHISNEKNNKISPIVDGVIDKSNDELTKFLEKTNEWPGFRRVLFRFFFSPCTAATCIISYALSSIFDIWWKNNLACLVHVYIEYNILNLFVKSKWNSNSEHAYLCTVVKVTVVRNESFSSNFYYWWQELFLHSLITLRHRNQFHWMSKKQQKKGKKGCKSKMKTKCLKSNKEWDMKWNRYINITKKNNQFSARAASTRHNVRWTS